MSNRISKILVYIVHMRVHAQADRIKQHPPIVIDLSKIPSQIPAPTQAVPYERKETAAGSAASEIKLNALDGAREARSAPRGEAGELGVGREAQAGVQETASGNVEGATCEHEREGGALDEEVGLDDLNEEFWREIC